MKKSWNTWNVRSVLSHVHLPEGIAISLGIKEYSTGQCLREVLIGREEVMPGQHAYDGSYTCLNLAWHNAKLRIETAVEDDEWYALVTPLATGIKTEVLTIEGAVLWNRPGFAQREQETLIIQSGETTVTVRASGTHREDEPVTEISSPYLLVLLDQPVSISTSTDELEETQSIIERKKEAFLATRQEHGDRRSA